MEGAPAETEQPAQRKRLEDGDFAEYIAGPAAQDAFTYGGEAGYLRYVYNEAKRRVDRDKMQPAHTVVIGRHDSGSEWPNVSYTTVEAEDKVTANQAASTGGAPPANPTPQTKPTENKGMQQRQPQNPAAKQAYDAEKMIPLPAATDSAERTHKPLGTDKQLPPGDVLDEADDEVDANDTNDQPGAPQVVQGKNASLTPELTAALENLQAKREAYASITADRRSSGREALLEGRRLALFARKWLLNPREYRRAESDQRANEQARTEYKQALDSYMALAPGDETKKVRAKLGQMLLFERSVLRHQQRLTYTREDQNGQPARTRWEEIRLALARRWRETGTPQRLGVTALAGVGLGLGLWASAATAPLWVPIFVGGTIATAAAGGTISGQAANEVNRFWPGTEPGAAEIRARVAEKLRDVFGYNRGMKKSDLPVRHEMIRDANATDTHEQLTAVAINDNAARTRHARRTGAFVTGGAFFVADGVASLIRSATEYTSTGPNISPNQTTVPSPTHNPTPTPSPPPTTPPNTVPVPPANLAHEFPWDAATQYNVAHHLATTPNSVWDTLHNAATQYNHSHGTNLDYVLHPNGKYWLEDGMRQIPSSRLADFNNFLWNLIPN